MKLRLSWILLLGFLVPVIAGTEEQVIDRTLKLDAGGTVSVKNINGSVRVYAWDSKDVRIKAVKKAKASSKRAALEKLERVEVLIDSQPGEITVVTTKEKRMFNWNDNVSVSYEVWVPENVVLRAKSTNGKVVVENVVGDVTATTTNGKVVITNVSGTVNARTTNGSIKAELAEYLGGDMEFRTTNGGIRFVGPSDIAMDIEARTTNGSIRSDFPIESRGLLSKKAVSGSINGGGAMLRLKTTNGSISLAEI